MALHTHRPMTTSLALTLCSSAALAALGQVLLKLGATGRIGIIDFINPFLLLGLSSYAAGVLLWIYALSRAPLYAVYPYTLLTFVLVGVASIVLFGERPNWFVMTGWATVVVGLILVSLGASHFS
jgi:drug/metabolite transporter (DMT)-like permease